MRYFLSLLIISNILVTEEGIVKLIDFGLSNFSQMDKLQSTFCGSPAFAAPEIVRLPLVFLMSKMFGTKYDGMHADVWSLGALLHTMITSKLPFQTLEEMLKGDYEPPSEVDEGSLHSSVG